MNAISNILLVLFAIAISNSAQAQGVWYTPYKDQATNTSYNQLFCDNLALYKQNYQGPITGPWQTLFSTPANIKSLQALAHSQTTDTRVRILAFNALEQHKVRPDKKELLAVIVEVGLEHGLDTLAAYKDMHTRYINQSGKLQVRKTHTPVIDAKIRKLFQETQPIIDKIGPWGKPRLPPPPAGQVRLTFLVSDGLYFGEGTMRDLSRSELAGPVLTAATELMFALTKN